LHLDHARLARAFRPLAAGCLLLGVAHIALLPPWEGFDETAHYSYIQELADTGSVPALETARVSTDVERYARDAPLPYASRPPFESNDGLTYRSFFEATRGGRPAAGPAHRRPDGARRYAPGSVANWEAQHPPLYYLVLAPVYRATRHLAWAPHLFSLRLPSYLFAWLAWVLAFHGCLAAMRPSQDGMAWRWAAIGTAAWPFLLPAWFPGFARIGNDSLAALVTTGVWLVSVHAARRGLETRHAVALGLLLGAGALTKASLVPVAAGTAGFWLFRAWSRRGGAPMAPVLARLALALAFLAAVAGWWYLRNRHPYLVPLAPAEVAAIRDGGGLLGGLERNFTLAEWARGHAALVATVAWSGTWSLARPPHFLLAPLALTVLLAGAGYLWAVRRAPPADLAWLAAWMTLPLLAALGGHVLLRIALSGRAITPGYYLHALVAPLGAALGLALARAFSRRAGRALALFLAAYALAFGLAVSWAQVLMFSGHLFKAGADKGYQSGSPARALLVVPEVLARLEWLAYPSVGAAAFVLGAALALAGLASVWKAARGPLE
jgi:hypothetical protein